MKIGNGSPCLPPGSFGKIGVEITGCDKPDFGLKGSSWDSGSERVGQQPGLG